MFIALLSVFVLNMYYIFGGTIYCMDPFEEARLQLIASITKVQENIQYWSNQTHVTNWEFRHAIQNNLDTQNDWFIAKRESERHLLSVQRALAILNKRLNSGNMDSSFSTSSTLGKRKL